ncbi:hypothetical protein BDV96DRAFT_585521 [Lophiotrema nucula]|uniref:Fe2OG dioxygenase domain-containing protein n=1 Tax=Lophiotrema nucula TaxID=690887 RepID=A0A6A5YQN8_9PLEO|nr:hypothetical protein BDV96DRAFT_585521 [Lophiotrema nucula]
MPRGRVFTNSVHRERVPVPGSNNCVGHETAAAVFVPAGVRSLTPKTSAVRLERTVLTAVSPDGTRVFGKKASPIKMKRGALEAFFKPTAAQAKKPKYEASLEKSTHAAYPHPIPHLPLPFKDQLGFVPAEDGKVLNQELDLDLVYYQPYIPSAITAGLFKFLRQELPFYRVQYMIKRGTFETQINTPRYTTVFGVDETSRFAPDGSLVDSKTGRPIEHRRYTCTPRPTPDCLDELRKITEGTTGEKFNFCLVNYYADGQDSISYHSDDERFLGPNPAVASFSLGARRDFLMKHKPIAPSASGPPVAEPKALKLQLGSGDMILMRGTTQSKWLHSIPKRAGVDAKMGRINITFRKVLVKGGTENYYQYNVGSGGVFRWNVQAGKMVAWEGNSSAHPDDEGSVSNVNGNSG